MATNGEVFIPSIPQQQATLTAPSAVTPSVTIMVPTTDLVVADPVNAMKDY